jgi:hypothetical protein
MENILSFPNILTILGQPIHSQHDWIHNTGTQVFSLLGSHYTTSGPHLWHIWMPLASYNLYMFIPFSCGKIHTCYSTSNPSSCTNQPYIRDAYLASWALTECDHSIQMTLYNSWMTQWLPRLVHRVSHRLSATLFILMWIAFPAIDTSAHHHALDLTKLYVVQSW